MSSHLRRKPLEKGRVLILEQLQNTARPMKASDRQAGAAKLQNTGPLSKKVSLEWLSGSPVMLTDELPSH